MRDMPDVPIEADSQRGYPADMEARLRVLEEIAAGTKAVLTEIRADQRAMRAEMTTGLNSMRAEMTAGLNSMRAEMTAGSNSMRAEMTAGFHSVRAELTTLDQRRERDFRLAFGAIITTSLGLAYLIAHTAHWL
jgi:hypothetical protein